MEAKQAAASAMGLLPKVIDLSTRLQVQIADAYVEGLFPRWLGDTYGGQGNTIFGKYPPRRQASGLYRSGTGGTFTPWHA